MAWPETRIDTMQGFIEAVDKLNAGWPNDARCLFRGQRDATDGLRSTLLRLFGARPDLESILKIETYLLHEFRSEAANHLPSHQLGGPDKNLIGWWPTMRHYGSPTRLIDWSLSPYVALFFAVEDGWDRDGAVWFVRSESVAGVMQAKKTTALYSTFDNIFKTYDLLVSRTPTGEVLFFEKVSKFERMAVQQGWFSVCDDPRIDIANALGDLDTFTFIEDLPGGEKKETALGEKHFHKYIIDRRSKPLLLRELHLMNITAKSLFPGIEGLGKQLCSLGKLGVSFGSPKPESQA